MIAAEPTPDLVETFVRLALSTAIYCGERTAEGVAAWASEVLPPVVRAQVGQGELLRRAVALLSAMDDEPTEELQREPRH